MQELSCCAVLREATGLDAEAGAFAEYRCSENMRRLAKCHAERTREASAFEARGQTLREYAQGDNSFHASRVRRSHMTYDLDAMFEQKPVNRRGFFREGLRELLRPMFEAVEPIENVARQLSDLENIAE